MNTKKSNQLNWRNKRTVETADPNAKVVLSDDTFVDFSELSTDPEVDEVKRSVSAIEAKIPTEASSQNQLADKDFVNEGIATASADFKGTYNSLQELEQVEANANDYGFVIVEDEYGNSRYDRYKYAESEGWLYEYSVNSVQFSNAQWNAINSGIVDSDVTKLNALPTASQLQASFNSKVDKEIGKGLSTEDYTTAEKTKLSEIATGAEVNVQSDWNETDGSSDAYIQNKPTNVSTFTNDAGYLTQHQDISGKVDVADFQEVEEVAAEALVDLDARVAALEQAIEALTNNA